jgi:Domain of unknown function (DU1801)
MDLTGFLETLPADRRDDVAHLDALIRETLPEATPGQAGGMLGYGPFHYRYASGREGDAHLVAVANRKAGLSLYVLSADGDEYLAERYAERLGRVSVGKSCVRFRRLDDVDLDALRDLLRDAWRHGGSAAA